MRKKKGFTMVEVVGCTVMLALIVIGVVAVSKAIDEMKVSTRNTVYLSLHNLNCMERLRQIALSEDEGLLLSYSDEDLGSDMIETTATIERATWDKYSIYNVTISSRMREMPQRLVSKYIITDIGGT